MNEQARIWVNGRRADEGPALLAVDHGVTVGDGVFETAKVVDGRVFALTRHHDRMDRSLAGLGLAPLDRGRVQEGIGAVLDEPMDFGRLRYTVTAGPGPLGSDRAEGDPTYIVTAVAMARPPEVTTVAVVPWVRNERGATVGLKTTSYADNVIALATAKELGGTEALFANTAGELCEGTGSNVFVISGGVVRTPPLSAGPLAGVTRGLVLEWAREEGLAVAEEPLPLTDLTSAEEVFITSSIRDVQAVERIRVAPAVHTLAGELPAPALPERELAAPGPVTRRLMDLFARYEPERFDP